MCVCVCVCVCVCKKAKRMEKTYRGGNDCFQKLQLLESDSIT